MAIAATGFVAILLVLILFNAGPLWRDEANSVNLAQMPSVKQLWENLRFDSCPVLWLFLLRAWSLLGLAGTDVGIRVLGLLIGLLFLGCLWLCTRWLGGRAPIITLALLGSLPAFINIVGANRAYGLALCLLLVNFGAVWRVVASPSKSRITIAGIAAVLFVHCIYYDGIFLYAMLFAAAVIVLRRKNWKALAALVSIGAVSGLSMVVYLPMILREFSHAGLAQVPLVWWDYWNNLNLAVTARSSARAAVSPGPEGIVWLVLLLLGIGAAIILQRQWTRQSNGFHCSRPQSDPAKERADLTLYATLSMLCGVAGFGCFLLKVQLPTESWYYVEALTLCAISLDSTMSTPLLALRPWGLMRIGFLLLAIGWGSGSMVEEALTRRTNVDLVAQKLSTEANKGDLVLIYGPWIGITFDRYYHGPVRWMTIPPIDSHKLCRADLIMEKLKESDPLAPTLAAIKDTFASGHDVWVVGEVQFAGKGIPLPHPPNLPPTFNFGAHFSHWCAQVMAHVLEKSQRVATSSLTVKQPINHLENVPLMRFSENMFSSEKDETPDLVWAHLGLAILPFSTGAGAILEEMN